MQWRSGLCLMMLLAGSSAGAQTRRPIDVSIAPFSQATWDAAKVKYSLGFLAPDDVAYSGQ